MWSAQGVATLKASLQTPGLKFESTKKESDTKVYERGTEITPEITTVTEPLSLSQQQNEIGPDFPLIPDNFEIDVNGTTTTSTEVCTNGEIRRLVLDSGAFIMGANLTLYGPNCEYYTLDEVIAELKDENARHNFNTFPYPITVKQPSPQSMQYITHISTQTGDYHVLSHTDRKVLALCHQLEIETHGDRFIKQDITEQSPQPQVQQPTKAAKKRAKKAAKKTTTPAAASTTASAEGDNKTTDTTTTTTNQSTATTTAAATSDSTPAVASTTTTNTKQNTTSQQQQQTNNDTNGWSNIYTCQKFDLQTFFTSTPPTQDDLLQQHEQNQEQYPPITSTSPKQLPPAMMDNGYMCYPSVFEEYTPPTTQHTTTSTTNTKKSIAKSKFILPGFDDGEWVSPNSVALLNTKAQLGAQIGNSRSAKITSLEANQLLPVPIVETEPAIGVPDINTQNDTTATITTTKDTTNNNNVTVTSPTFQQPHQHSAQPQQTSLSSVGCITTDYSMQNVMLQAGLRCLTLDGRAIATIRQYIMGCHACRTLSKDMARGFCPSCGGFTMVRIIVNVGKDGKAYYSWPTHRIENTRGTIFQVSKAQTFGRKGAGKIIVREDMMPKPSQKQLKIARGEKVDPNADKSLFDEAALFGFMRQYQKKGIQHGFGKKNTNIARRKK